MDETHEPPSLSRRHDDEVCSDLVGFTEDGFRGRTVDHLAFRAYPETSGSIAQLASDDLAYKGRNHAGTGHPGAEKVNGFGVEDAERLEDLEPGEPPPCFGGRGEHRGKGGIRAIRRRQHPPVALVASNEEHVASRVAGDGSSKVEAKAYDFGRTVDGQYDAVGPPLPGTFHDGT